MPWVEAHATLAIQAFEIIDLENSQTHVET